VSDRCPADVLNGCKGPGGSEAAVTRNYRVNIRLQREGEHAGSLRFVKFGLLAVRQRSSDGSERAIAMIGPGSLLGQSALNAQPSLFTVQAMTPVSVCEFANPLPMDASSTPASSAAVLSFHNRQVIRTLADWSAVVRMSGLSQRLAHALRLIAEMQPPGQTQLPNQSMLAELLCVTRESINREWKAFEARGLVHRRHRQAVDLDLPALERLSVLRD
jgi:CRP-like cAMP-binding protein